MEFNRDSVNRKASKNKRSIMKYKKHKFCNYRRKDKKHRGIVKRYKTGLIWVHKDSRDIAQKKYLKRHWLRTFQN